MKTAKAGTPGFAAPSSYVPPHYLRRVARSIVLRAAMRGRLAWHVALPVLNHLGGQEVQRSRLPVAARHRRAGVCAARTERG